MIADCVADAWAIVPEIQFSGRRHAAGRVISCGDGLATGATGWKPNGLKPP